MIIIIINVEIMIVLKICPHIVDSNDFNISEENNKCEQMTDNIS